MKHIGTRRLALNAVLIAIYFVLNFYSIKIGNNIKLTFAAFPRLVAALLFGPVDGVLVAGIGEFLIQLLLYGLSPTTVLWVIPPVAHALTVGLYAWRRGFELNRRQMGFIVLVAGLVNTIITSFSLYLDARIWGYPSKLTGIVLLFRFINSIIMCAVYMAIMPRIIPRLRRVINRQAGDFH